MKSSLKMSPSTIADLKLKHLHTKITVKWIFNDILNVSSHPNCWSVWFCSITATWIGQCTWTRPRDQKENLKIRMGAYVELIYKPLMIWNTMVWVLQRPSYQGCCYNFECCLQGHPPSKACSNTSSTRFASKICQGNLKNKIVILCFISLMIKPDWETLRCRKRK